MKLSRYIAAGAALVVAGTLAWGAGMFSTLPIVGNPSFCASTVTGAGGLGGITGQGQASTGSICGQTVPAGPPALSGNELIPGDTGLVAGNPQTVTIPAGMLVPGPNGYVNALTGPDFGINLWQRLPQVGANLNTVVNAAIYPGGNNALMTADGWYSFSTGAAGSQTITVTRQTGAADILTNNVPGVASTASLRMQRVASQTGVQLQCVGQLLPDTESVRFLGNTAIFSTYLLAGANFSPTGNNVTLTIAYHTAADAGTLAANGQGTNTGTFASSLGATQNITGYIELVNTIVNPTTTWGRYSTSAVVPTVNAAGTVITGLGVKICWTPVGTAGTNDFLEIADSQFEARLGLSVGPSPFSRRTLIDEWNLEYARYYAITESPNAGTPFYASGQATTTNGFNFTVPFPSVMRTTPVASPFNKGTFKVNAAGTLVAVTSFDESTTVQNNLRMGSISGSTAATLTAGQGTTLVGGGSGTGVLAFSAEP